MNTLLSKLRNLPRRLQSLSYAQRQVGALFVAIGLALVVSGLVDGFLHVIALGLIVVATTAFVALSALPLDVDEDR